MSLFWVFIKASGKAPFFGSMDQTVRTKQRLLVAGAFTMSQFRHNYAIFIGIDDYQNGIATLKTAANDARVLADLLQTKHNYDTTLLLDQSATLKHLTDLLTTELPQKLGADDRLLFYFAGHGIALDGEDGPAGYLIPQDAQLQNPATFWRMQEVHDALHALPCRHLLAIFDCCFAGAFRWSNTRKLIPPPQVIHKERYDRFIRDPAWQVITSAASNQLAWDTLATDERGQMGQHSPFAMALIQALQGGADAVPPATNHQPAGDGVITATELYLYLRDAIELDVNTPNQTPGLWSLQKHDKGEFIFLTPDHALNLPPAPPLDQSNNPYRGLNAFDEADSPLFFGRATLVEKLATTIAGQPLTVVLGASGSGKSSLVRAGLIPYLRSDQESPSAKHWWIVPPLRPGESPFQSLNRSLISANLSPVDANHTLTERISQWRQSSPVMLLLVVDQLEELITLCPNQTECHQFLQQLAAAITSHADRLRLVLTLRSDFEPHFRQTALEPNWTTARFLIPGMTREELRQAIEAPASARVLYFDPHSLVDQLIDEVVQMPGALPLLSFTLSELYLKYLRRQEQAQQQGEIIDRAITQQDYNELGGVARSLTQRADQEYETLIKRDPACGRTVQHAMLRMVAVTSGEMARRRVPLSELDYPEPEQQRVEQVIDQFSQARLLVSSTDATGKPYVEPAHDAMVRGWQRLLDWANAAQETLLLQRRLTPAAEEWRNQQKPAYLWNSDPRLSLLNQILHSPNNWLNRVEAEFVQRSIQQRRKNRTLRTVLIPGGVAALLIAAVVARTRGELADLQLRAFRAENLLTLDSASGLVAAIQAAGQNLDQLPNTVIESVAANLLEAIDKAREANRFTADEQGNVRAITVSGDGQTLVSGGDDGRLHLWNPKGEEIASPFAKHPAAITAVAISQDGQTIVTSDQTGTAYLWNRQGGLINLPWRSDTGNIRSVAIRADGKLIVSGDDGGTVRLWNQQGKSQVLPIPATQIASINQVAISANGQTIASGDQNGIVRIWNGQGEAISQLRGHQGSVEAVAVSNDGQWIVTGGRDTTVRLWNRQGELIGDPYRGHVETVNTVEIWTENDQIRIISGSDDETIRQWDGKGNAIDPPFRAFVNSVNALVISPDGKQVLSGCGDGTIGIWDIQPNPVSLTVNAKQGTVNTVAVSTTGKWIATGGNNGTIRFWDSNGEARATILESHQDFVRTVAISPDDQTIVSGDDTGLLYLWNRQGTLKVPPIPAHTGSVQSVAVSSDNQQIISGGEDGKVRFWSLQGDSTAPAFSAHTHVNAVAISQDRSLIATGGDQSVRLWDRKGNEIIPALTNHQGAVRAIAISPDGQQIASGSEDRQVRIWSRTGELLQQFDGHQGGVTSLAFSSDGRWLTSGSEDRTFRVWDTRAEIDSLAFRTHSDTVYGVTFLPSTAASPPAPGQETIVSVSRDGTLQILRERRWQEWLNVACRRLQYHRRIWAEDPNGVTDAWTEIKQEARETCRRFWQE